VGETVGDGDVVGEFVCGKEEVPDGGADDGGPPGRAVSRATPMATATKARATTMATTRRRPLSEVADDIVATALFSL
jgi:hypothetical protein